MLSVFKPVLLKCLLRSIRTMASTFETQSKQKLSKDKRHLLIIKHIMNI